MQHHPALLDLYAQATERPSRPAHHDLPVTRSRATSAPAGNRVRSFVVSVHNLFNSRPARTA